MTAPVAEWAAGVGATTVPSVQAVASSTAPLPAWWPSPFANASAAARLPISFLVVSQ